MRPEAVIAKINPEANPNGSSVGLSNPKDKFLRENLLGISGLNPLIVHPENPALNSKGKWPLIRPVNAEIFTQAKAEKPIDLTKKPTNSTEHIEQIVAMLAPKIEEIRKSLAYNPGKRTKEYDHMGRRILRIRRKSRCDGIHDAEEKPCGSPRCRTKNRVKLEKKQTPGKEKNTTVKSKNRRTRTLVFGRKIN